MTKIENKQRTRRTDSPCNSDYMNYKTKNILGFKSTSIKELGDMTNRSDTTCFVSHLTCQNSCGESTKVEVDLRPQKKIQCALRVYNK